MCRPSRLALKAFAPGAYLAYGRGELRTVADPLRAPRYLWQTLPPGGHGRAMGPWGGAVGPRTCGLASVRDLLALLRLRLGQLLWETAYSALEEPEESSTEQPRGGEELRFPRVGNGWTWIYLAYLRLLFELAFTGSCRYLRQLGLSDSLVERFLRPFFEAIYVTPLKEQSSRCARGRSRSDRA